MTTEPPHHSSMPDRAIEKFSVARGVAAIVLTILSGSWCCAMTTQVPLFDTPEWRMNLKYEVGLRLRRERAEGGALLIKHDESTLVRRYDPEAQTLANVGVDSWERAAGAIARCEGQFPPDRALLWTDNQTGKLHDAQVEIQSAGPTILNLTAAPQGDKVAVLSAKGKKPISLLPFGGGSGASGEYWHQVWSLRTHAYLGPAVRIPTHGNYASLRACWSMDENLIVYYEVTFSYLSVVTVKKEASKEQEKRNVKEL